MSISFGYPIQIIERVSYSKAQREGAQGVKSWIWKGGRGRPKGQGSGRLTKGEKGVVAVHKME
jgi:hypothetical protein